MQKKNTINQYWAFLFSFIKILKFQLILKKLHLKKMAALCIYLQYCTIFILIHSLCKNVEI